MKNKNYGHFTQYERDRLQAMLDGGYKQKDIAEVLNRDPGSISREIKRNRKRRHRNGRTYYGRYRATIAGNKSYVRRKYSKYQGKKINEDKELREYIISGLKNFWNPDEISGKMKKDGLPFYVGKTAIYEWLYSVWGQRYCRYLPAKQYGKKKRNKYPAGKRQIIPNRIGIEMRPAEIGDNSVYGHCEADTIVSGKRTGSKAALAVVCQMKSKYLGIQKILSMKPAAFKQAIWKIKNSQAVLSLTLDNGLENREHEQFGVPTYFCDKYSSWQKPKVENSNGTIRRFFPKGCDIDDYSDEYVRMVEDILNNKPRRSLGYKTPMEIMLENNLIIKKTEAKKLHFGGELARS
jgi:IS30 family transposase